MEVSIISIIPFILLLLSIAVLPFISPEWWKKFYPYISVSFAISVALYYLSISKTYELLRSLEDYVMFISLLASLFIVSGGILIELKGYSTPLRNVLLLVIGIILANFIGTTGASMLLIRPYIKTNKNRISAFHIVFFIFIVSNIGGALTPVSDPPLLLGFLKGIPFFWIGEKVLLKWLVANSLLLAIFYFLDRRSFLKQPDELENTEKKAGEKLVFKGWYNVMLLIVIIISVFISKPLFLRETIMLLAALISYKVTNKGIHRGNYFNFHPIREVAWLFIGIFITMAPVLELLKNNSSALGMTSPSQFFWVTGFLSAFLDSAPAYLTSMTTAMAIYGLDINNTSHIGDFIANHSINIVAISVSAVFFGAFSYLGNGPNFMIKFVAEQNDIKTPGFFSYIIKYSVPILLPIYIIIWFLFFS